MKKLLLLTMSMVSISLNDFAAGANWHNNIPPSDSTHTDSVVTRQEIKADPKDAFKDLFIATTITNGFSTAKLNPLAISFVQDYMESMGENLTKMKGWGKPYFDVMNNILAQHGLPTELKYLSVIESALKSYAVSWAGAVGPWQFMPATARDLGLRVNGRVDERTDFQKSTHAAARYLTELYGIYKDWLLVIAAYNCGPGGVNSAIRKSGSRNFWDLQYYLPSESRNHVKKFIATHYIMEGDGGVTTVTKSESDNLMLNGMTAGPNMNTANGNTELLEVSGKYHSLVIAQHVQLSITAFNQLNPNFDKALAANGTYNLKLPAEKMLAFQAKKPQILEQSIQLFLTMDGR
jgi:membrane-bound lytic murein transglycosylase D